MMEDLYCRNSQRTINFMHVNDNINVHMDFHLHDFFEIFFFVSGDINYFIEKNVYSLKQNDLLVINSSEIHKPSGRTNSPNERIWVTFDPSVPALMNSSDFDMLGCFNNRGKGEDNKISLNRNQVEEILSILFSMEKAHRDEYNGSNILMLGYLMELLVVINRASLHKERHTESYKLPDVIVKVLDYIDHNTGSDLSLDSLSRNYFINKIYLCNLFRESTGINLHKYIIYKRISMAKNLLMQGHNVTEAGKTAGFNDYSNFIRTFKKITGVSPGKYMYEKRINYDK